ncbi:hypothetical protein J4461_04430 [Candidatus Pacearchaeota archaeon]|nr:hypothetical protein [Candidatus Pacearchaeota archaeon]
MFELEDIILRDNQPNLAVGDMIELQFANAGSGSSLVHAKVEGIYVNRAIPDIDETIIGTRNNPGIKFQIFHVEGDEWKQTEKCFGLTMNRVKRTIVGYKR